MDVHSHNTRSKKLVHINQHNKSAGLRMFNHLGATLWNSLPQYVRDVVNIILFKNKMKNYLNNLL